MHLHLVFIMYLQSWTAISSINHNSKAAITIDLRRRVVFLGREQET